jgi:hypothetical protein
MIKMISTMGGKKINHIIQKNKNNRGSLDHYYCAQGPRLQVKRGCQHSLATSMK